MFRDSGLRNLSLFVFLALAWGTSYAAIDVGLRRLPPLLFGGLRYDVAALLLFAVAVAGGQRLVPQKPHEWATVAVGGTFLIAFSIAGLFLGQQFVPSTTAAIVQSVTPVLTPVFAWGLLDRRLGIRTVAGSLLGLLGVAIVAGWEPTFALPQLGAGLSGDLVATLPNTSATVVGVAILFGGSASFALGSVLLERLPPTLPTTTAQAWMMAIGALLLHVWSLALGEPVPTFDLPSLGAVLYLAAVSGAAGYLLYYDLLNSIGPVRVSLVNYVTPLVAAIFGWLLLGERLGLAAVAGFLLVAVGFAAMQWETLVAFQARFSDEPAGVESLAREPPEAWEWGPGP